MSDSSAENQFVIGRPDVSTGGLIYELFNAESTEYMNDRNDSFYMWTLAVLIDWADTVMMLIVIMIIV